MEFAICFKGFVEPNRAKALVRQAENAGFMIATFYGERAFLQWLCALSTLQRCGLVRVLQIQILEIGH